ncbi:flagellin [Halanaerobium saccharolyticum]|jgi:flagellin|uniref:Flagellin n=1 Tax=Halanaerobium saccharolyticum TaxID=43595 RepID=A0A4R6RS81_9FIRM|nr:flagellin [Halanaerobium saccharolyticum]TDP89660.1 flagellin [Halanaerobium saccharolyticum]
MRINTNVAALNSYNQLKNTQNNLSKSLSRLSSGKRINGAADDAAGLAISEKMNAQTRGLAQAQRNAQDGISMIQTAEGALKESHSILQRMRELAVQSGNDTNTADDRAEIQKEVDQLSQELTRIGKTTEFNTQKLLNGTVEDIKFQIGANEQQNMQVSISDMRGHALGVAGEVKTEETAAVTDGGDNTTDLGEGDYTVSGNLDDGLEMLNSDGVAVATSSNGLTWSASSGDDTITFTKGTVTSGTISIDGSGNATAEVGVENLGLEAGTYTVSGTDLLDENGNVVASDNGSLTTFSDPGGTDLVTFSAAVADGDTIEVGGVDVASQTSADKAITTLDDAIASVSEERSKLGAVQNRLDHTINNLNTAEENLTAAESRISDVDMAKEMMNMSKQQILSQAGTAMMAQANQLPQGVLQLLG